jgi:prephenate dehydrogenase
MKRVAIAGVGLIGGSFALALRQAGFDGEIWGVSSPKTLAEALSARVIDSEATLERAAAEADLLLLAQPIRTIVEQIPILGAALGPHTLVTDAGSTKALICAAAAQHLPAAQFVGGHPMAGKESRGVAASDPNLFRGRTWVLTRRIDHPYSGWLERIGAHVVYLDPGEHDRTVALTSHLPQLVSSALAATVGARLEQEDQLRAGGPGLIDMTRLALSPYEIWGDILDTNREAVEEALDRMIEELASARAGLGEGRTSELFEKANTFRRRLVPTINLR